MSAAAKLVPIEDLPPSATVRDIPITRVRKSPWNKRVDFGDLSEFEPGIKIPALARPVPPDAKGRDIELVFGHRRMEGAEKFKHPTIPIIVREMGDDEVIDAQIIEHLRKNPTPLEEASWYATAHVERKRPVEELARKYGRSVKHINERLRIAALPASVKKLLEAGELDIGRVMFVTRIPNAKVQEEAAAAIANNRPRKSWEPVELPLAKAKEIVLGKYMLLLSSAPFDTKDGTLIPKAGACVGCPKNTDSQTDLLKELGTKSLCTDAACFNEKKSVFVQIQVEKAEAAGRVVLTKAEAAKHFYAGSNQLKDSMVDIRATNYEDPKRRTYRHILGKNAQKVAVLVPMPDGSLQELIPKNDLAPALKEAGFKPMSDRARHSGAPSAYDRETKKRRIRSATMKAAYPLLVEKLNKEGVIERDALRIVAIRLLKDRPEEEVLKRHDIKKPSYNGFKDFAFLDKLKVDKLRVLVTDLAVQRVTYDIQSGYPAQTELACKVFGVDLAGIEKEKTPAKKKPAKDAKSKSASIAAIAKAAKKGKAAPLAADEGNDADERFEDDAGIDE